VPLVDLVVATDDDIAELTAENQTKNVYFGLGLRCDGLSHRQQGGKQDVIALPGFAGDLDVAHPEIPGAHAAQNLPPTDDAALDLLYGGPDPSMLVFTGYGWHPYWLFHKPWILRTPADRKQAQRAYQSFQQTLIDRGAAKGWQVDSTATIQRVWRVPGFDNLKGGARALVRLEYLNNAVRYDPSEIAAGISRISVAVPVPPPAAPSAPAPGPVPVDVVLLPVVNAMRVLDPQHRNKAAINAVLMGQSFADSGNRDAVMQAVCSTIVWISPTARTMDPVVLARVLEASLSIWAAEPGAEKTLDEELEKAAEKLARAQEDFRVKDAKQSPQLQALARALRKSIGPDEPDEPNEPSDDQHESAFVRQHAIIQHKTTFHVFDFNEPQRYSHPLTRDEVLVYARDAWETTAIFDLTYINDKDVEKQKTIGRILQEYATNARKIIGDMTLQESYFSTDEREFYHAVLPLRNLTPRFDTNIATWLLLLSSDHEKLLDWLAVVTFLDKPCCALYLSGATGSGKNLLSEGVARLWQDGGPTLIENVIGGSGFNADIFQCPLIYVDEGLPKGVKDISIKLRALIGATSFTSTEKYLANHRVRGSVRLLIGANNDSVLSMGSENMTQEDMKAVSRRFLHLSATEAAADWLVENNPANCLTDRWVVGDLMARHLLWLRDNRVVTPGKRFIVEGESSEIHRRLLMQGPHQDVFEWLVRFMSAPEILTKVYRTKKETPLAQVGAGKLLVNTQGAIDCWDLYMKTPVHKNGAQYIGAALKKLSNGTINKKVDGKRCNFHKIDSDNVFGWATEYQIGDLDQMKVNYGGEAEKC